MNKTGWSAIWKKSWRVAVGVLGLAVMVVYSSGALVRKVPPGRVPHEPGIPVPEGAARHVVKAKETGVWLELVGTTTSEELIRLSARIPAHVKEVLVSAGDRVKAGQVVLTLDDRDLREQQAAAEAQFKQAESEFHRTKQLFDAQASTQQALAAAESAYRAARAHLEQATVMRTYAEITSPIDGVVTDRRIEAGDLASPGQLLMAVYAPDRMRLEVPVPVRLIDRVALGQRLEVLLDRPARLFEGEVTAVVAEIDPLSRTQAVRVRLLDPQGVLPGTFGRLNVHVGDALSIWVPRSAVYRAGQLEYVHQVQDGRAVRRLVKPGAVRGEEIEILSGLKDGDEVLVAPVQGA